MYKFRTVHEKVFAFFPKLGGIICFVSSDSHKVPQYQSLISMDAVWLSRTPSVRRLIAMVNMCRISSGPYLVLVKIVDQNFLFYMEAKTFYL